MTNFLLVVGGFAGIFVFGELVHRTWQVSSETTRRGAHVFAGLLAATLPWYLTYREMIFLGVSFSVLLVLSQWFNFLPSIHAVNRKTVGEVTFPLGLFLIAILFFRDNPIVFQLGALTLALGDSSASLIGQSVGRKEYRVFGNRKTYEGSFAFFIVSVLLVAVFVFSMQPIVPLIFAKIVAVGIMLTIIEAIAVKGWDNLALPVATATLSLWLGLL